MTEVARRATLQPGAEGWQPALLRIPSGARRVIAEWVPVLVRRRRLTTLAFLVLFLVLQFLIPARLVISGMGAPGRPSAAVGVGLAFLWLLSAVRAHRLPEGRQPIRWVVGLFVGTQLLGYVIGFDRLPSPIEASAANRWLIFVVSIAGVILAVADGMRTRVDLDRLLKTLVALASVMAFVGVLQFLRIVDLVQYISIPGLQPHVQLFGVGERGDGGLARVAGTANHYIEFGVVLALVLPIALHYALFARTRQQKIWQWTFVALVATGIPLSISRSATLAAVATMILIAVVWPWRQRYNALVISLVAIVAFRVINPGVLGTIRSLFTNALEDTSVTDRIDRTAYVMDLWGLRPWFGRGAGMVIPEEYILLDNQFYMTLLAGGVFGVAVLFIFFLAPYGIARSTRLRGRDEETRHLANALAASVAAAMLSAATFDAFSFTTWVGVVSVTVGAIGALWRLDGTNLRRPLQRGEPGDRLVAPPLMSGLSARLHGARTMQSDNHDRGEEPCERHSEEPSSRKDET